MRQAREYTSGLAYYLLVLEEWVSRRNERLARAEESHEAKAVPNATVDLASLIPVKAAYSFLASETGNSSAGLSGQLG